MSWGVARRRDFPELIQLLKEREWYCVPFSSRVKHAQGVLWASPLRLRIYLHRNADHAITDALLITSGGLTVPAFAQESRGAGEAGRLRRLIASSSRSVHSIIGVRRHVEAVSSLVCGTPTAQVDYFLMVQETALPDEAPVDPLPGMTVQKATPADLDRLYPLQRDYELEEVLIDPRRFSPIMCRNLLRANLKNELTYYAEYRGEVVAKAGTNARGYRYDQLGGVFTSRTYRNRGVAARVVAALLRDANQDDRRTCLFVKDHNAAAVRLYEKLGFQIRDRFRISYYFQ